MLEHLAWHAVHAVALANKVGSLPHPPGAGMEVSVARPIRPAPPPPQAPGNVAAPEGGGEAASAALEAGSGAHQGSIPAGPAPLWAPLRASSPHPMGPAHPGDLAAPADPAAMPVRDS